MKKTEYVFGLQTNGVLRSGIKESWLKKSYYALDDSLSGVFRDAGIESEFRIKLYPDQYTIYGGNQAIKVVVEVLDEKDTCYEQVAYSIKLVNHSLDDVQYRYDRHTVLETDEVCF